MFVILIEAKEEKPKIGETIRHKKILLEVLAINGPLLRPGDVNEVYELKVRKI